ncbi:hypothetical protein ES705_50330 [subsurface metagenome]
MLSIPPEEAAKKHGTKVPRFKLSGIGLQAAGRIPGTRLISSLVDPGNQFNKLNGFMGPAGRIRRATILHR